MLRHIRAFSERWLGRIALGGVSLLGLAVLTMPLWAGASAAASPPSGMGIPIPPLGLPLLVVGLGLCLMALTVEAAAGLGPRGVALIAVLAAINSALRVAEVIVPGPGGFSPVFVLIILAGYVYGPRFGFLVGVFTMAVSALVTGFVDPWLPAQAIVAGWVGATAGLIPLGRRAAGRVAFRSTDRSLDSSTATRTEIVWLVVFGATWGLLYGALLSLPFWTVLEAARPADSDGGLTARALRFGAYYGVSSFGWDLFRSFGNVALILLIGRPTIVALRRVGAWFSPAIEGSEDKDADRAVHAVSSDGAVCADGEQGSGGRASEAMAARTRSSRSETVPHPLPALRLPQPAPDPLHPHAWAAWLGGALALAALVTNPVVLAAALLAIEVVRSASRRGRGSGDGPVIPVARLVLGIVFISAAYNMLFAHGGSTVLARLPTRWPLIGGTLTAEALAFGAMNGLRLAMLILAFFTFQAVLPARQLVRLIPRAFGTVSLLAGVALTWVPSTRLRVLEVREAAQIRGFSRPGVRGWIPLAMPMLVGGLERAMGLAEVLTARGITAESPPVLARILLAAGAAALVWAGIIVQLVGRNGQVLAALIGAAGIASLVAATLLLSRHAPRTSFRSTRWRHPDSIIALGALLTIAAAFVPGAWEAMRFSPYPTLAFPSTDWPLILPLIGLVLPAFFVSAHHEAATASDEVEEPETAEGGVDERAGQKAPPSRSLMTPSRGPSIIFRNFGADYPILGGRSHGGADRLLRTALDDVSVTMPGGLLTLVAGPSGAGKSTLLRSTCGLVPHFSGGAVRGSVRVVGWDPVALGPAAMSGQVAFVGGDPARAFVVDRVADEVAFALEQRALPPSMIRQRVASALTSMGIGHLALRRIETLSGGERQRVAIAAALALAPPVLVLDEPTSQLDDDSAQRVLSAIIGVMDAGRRTVVLSEHRLDRMRGAADHMVWLPGLGERPVEGTPAEIGPMIVRPEIPQAPRNQPGEARLELHEVTFAHSLDRPNGSTPTLDQFSLSVRGGELVAMTGPSGSGKTTVLRLAVGLLRPSAGAVHVLGRDIAGTDPSSICRDVGYVPQDPDTLLSAETVRQELELGLSAHRSKLGDGREPFAPDDLLARLGIGHLASRYPRDLSAGERLRVALAAVMLTRPTLLLLDEPTRGLDDRALADLANLLHELVVEGHAVLVATHDRRLIGAAHRHVHLKGASLEIA